MESLFMETGRKSNAAALAAIISNHRDEDEDDRDIEMTN